MHNMFRSGLVSPPSLQVAEQMESALNYQEVYLGQIQLLNVVPIKELAATFANLKVYLGPLV